jgi:hypothetical protein
MENNELITEETIPTEEATVQEADETTKAENTNEVGDNADSTNDTEEAGGSPPLSESFRLRYNHEDVDVSMDEAKRLAQMGKHFEDNVKKTIDSLDYVATLQGKSVKDLVDALVNGVDAAYREELETELGVGNPLVEEMMELRRSKNKKSFEEAKAQRTAAEEKAEEEAQKRATLHLAEQFESIRETFPEYDTIEKVPDAVIKKALSHGDLEKEMLRYMLSERNKIDSQKATAEKNKKENIGSARTETNESGISDAFMEGLWG